MLRGGLKAALESLNEVPLRREMIVELDNLWTTGKFEAKIGDGVTHYIDLPYLAAGGGVETIVPSDGISVDNTDPKNPVISSSLAAVAIDDRVADYASLPTAGMSVGDTIYVEKDELAYIWDGTAFPTQGAGFRIGWRVPKHPRLIFGADLACCLDARDITADDGSALSTWSDSGGSGNSFTASGTDRPVYRVAGLGGAACVAFDGTMQMAAASALIPTNAKCAIGAVFRTGISSISRPVFAQYSAGASGRSTLSADQNNAGSFGSGQARFFVDGASGGGGSGGGPAAFTYSDPCVFLLTNSGGTLAAKERVNGGAIDQFTMPGILSSPTYLGGYSGLAPGSRFNGEIGAFVVIKRAITDDERAKLESWLRYYARR
jgi:hypothetical protein